MTTDIGSTERFEHHFEALLPLLLGLAKLASQVEDEDLGRELRALLSDVHMHWDGIGELAHRLTKPEVDNRHRERARVLGSAVVRFEDAVLDARGQCMDLSTGGLRLRMSKPVTPGQRYELEILMLGASETLVHTMKASWCRVRAGGEGYWAGFEHDSGEEGDW